VRATVQAIAVAKDEEKAKKEKKEEGSSSSITSTRFKHALAMTNNCTQVRGQQHFKRNPTWCTNSSKKISPKTSNKNPGINFYEAAAGNS
jgi:hypothetical protein